MQAKNMLRRAVVGCDLGGTYIKMALVTEGRIVFGPFVHRLEQAEKLDPEVLVSRIQGMFHTCEDKSGSVTMTSFGVCCPGLVDNKRNTVVYSRNLNLKRFDIGAKIREFSNLDVVVENDSKAAALGELTYGSAKGAKDLIYLTLGTGLGGALILDGKLHRGLNNAAGEFGHMSLDAFGDDDPNCNNVGCVHQYVSGKGVEQATGMSYEQIVAGARLGNWKRLDILAKSMNYLSIEITNLVNAFDPELVVIGGGNMGKAHDLLWPLLASAYKHRAPSYTPRRAKLAMAKLYDREGRDLSGIFGVALLASGRIS